MTDTFAWSDAFAMGHKELDADHRRLVDSIADICAAVHAGRPRDELQPLLEGLQLLAEVHFQREDAVMLEIAGGMAATAEGSHQGQAFLEAVGGAALEQHAQQHAMALAKLASISRDLEFGANHESTLCFDLKRWFIQHAIKYDAHLKTIFQSM